MARSEYTGSAAGIAKVMRVDSKYLGAADLDATVDTWVAIAGVVALDDEEIGGKKAKGRRFALRMETLKGTELDKCLLLNRTNLATIRELYGDATRDWKGKAIGLYVSSCDAFGERTACVRIRHAKVAPTQQRQAKPQTEETQTQLGDAAEPEVT